MSQVQLSAAVGMTKGAVSSWEADAYLPPMETVTLLAIVLGVTPEWLGWGRGERYLTATEQASMTKRLAKPARTRRVSSSQPAEKKKKGA